MPGGTARRFFFSPSATTWCPWRARCAATCRYCPGKFWWTKSRRTSASFPRSDYEDIGRGQRRMALEGGDELRRPVAVAVGVVPELPAVAVVDDAVVGVVRRTGHRGPEARVAGREVAVRPDRGHHRVLHVQLVDARG